MVAVKLARDEESVAVHLWEMVGVVDETQVLRRMPSGATAAMIVFDEAEDAVRAGPPACRRPGRHAAAGPLDRHARGIETRGFGEHVERNEGRIDRMADQPAAREIGGRTDRSARIHGDGEGRAVEGRVDSNGAGVPRGRARCGSISAVMSP